MVVLSTLVLSMVFLPLGNAPINGDVDKLKAAVAAAVAKPEYQARDGKTFCNVFVRDVVQDVLKQSRQELSGTANEQFTKLSNHANWKKLDIHSLKLQESLEEAHAKANAGKIVLVLYKNDAGHGHISIIVPAANMEDSGAWGMKMPFMAQAGPKNPRNLPNEADKSVFDSLKMSYGFKKTALSTMEIVVFQQ